jgi:hypothetical protein
MVVSQRMLPVDAFQVPRQHTCVSSYITTRSTLFLKLYAQVKPDYPNPFRAFT